MSIYKAGPEEARKLTMKDPAARARWFEPHIDTWLVPFKPVTLGDSVDIEV